MASFAVNDSLTLRLNAYNLADKDYLIDAGNTGLQLGIPTYIVGPPRMYGLRFAYSFGAK